MTQQGGETPSLERLQALARACGVGVDFWGFYGDLHAVAAETLTRTLRSLGVDASTADGVEKALADREDGLWRRMLPPTVVQRQGQSVQVPVHVTHGDPVRVWVLDEQGREWPTAQVDLWVPPREVDGVTTGRATFATPSGLPLGWHVLRADSRGLRADAVLVVVPQRLTTADELPDRTGHARTWGLMTQLYSVRSERSWGIGDAGDLADLAAIAGAEGADWVLVNPLHAAEPLPPVESSPYLPTTRRFANPLYIRVEAIPECAYLAATGHARVRQLGAAARAGNRDATALRRDPAYARKLQALEIVYAVPRSPARQRLFERFRAEQGKGLEDFALWCALRAEHGADDPWWDSVPPDGPEADAERERLGDRIDFACWLQWVMDEQLQAAQAAARECGMGLGVVHDLAVGVHWRGADAWTLGQVLAHGAAVGAPADMYNQQGQNWSQPPWHPGRLAEVGYAPWRDMLRTILRHAGGIRIDHVLGLFRLWWVPEGLPASQGTYVYYDHEALVGILCLEAQRAGAVVIGEDLGTFEPWVREYLAARGLLGTSILWFENAPDHTPIPPEEYRQACLASVNTHDLPPTAGYLAGEHIALRERLGLLARPVQEEIAADREEKARVLGLCRERGLLGDDPTEQETVEALYRLLAGAPSVMHGVALVDAVGDRRIQNQPGTDEEYPNWCIPLTDSAGRAVLVEDLPGDGRARSLFAAVREALA